MTKEQALRYIDLMDRRMFILLHSGVDWKPEYGPEMEQISKELKQLRPLWIMYDLPSNPCHKAGSMGKKNAEEMQFRTLPESERFIAANPD